MTSFYLLSYFFSYFNYYYPNYKYNNKIYCYKSTGYKTAYLLINYFDSFNLFSQKYVDYLKFRKIYIMITKGQHLEKKGIIIIKSITSKGSSETSTQEV